MFFAIFLTLLIYFLFGWYYAKIFIIINIIIWLLRKLFIERMTNDKKDDKKKTIFSIIVEPNKMKNINKHIKGFGSQTSLNVYKVDYKK